MNQPLADAERDLAVYEAWLANLRLTGRDPRQEVLVSESVFLLRRQVRTMQEANGRVPMAETVGVKIHGNG